MASGCGGESRPHGQTSASQAAGERIAHALAAVTASAASSCTSTTCWVRQMDDLARAARTALTATAEVGGLVPMPCRSLVPEINEWLVMIRSSAEKARRLRSPPVGTVWPTAIVRDDVVPLANGFRECAAPE
jgi:hypothetical protein